MPEDVLQSMGGKVAGEARGDIAKDVIDLVSEVATQELKDRHPGSVVKDPPPHGALARAFPSDELDAQVPKGTVPFEGIEE